MHLTTKYAPETKSTTEQINLPDFKKFAARTCQLCDDSEEIDPETESNWMEDDFCPNCAAALRIPKT